MGSSSSRLGLRRPDSSRDSVLTEMPVASDSPASVAPRSLRIRRSRGPTSASTSSVPASPVAPGLIPSFVPVDVSSLIPTLQNRQSHLSIRRRSATFGAEVVTMTETYEVVVVGGGTAGLSAALVLGRARRRTLVVDAGEPRNAPAAHLQGYLTRDGMPPAAFLAEGRREVEGYGVEIVRDHAVDVVRDGTGEFDVTLGSGRAVHVRRLIVTTGLADELPAVPGVAERFGRDVLHCPYCHGWEVRDEAFGVLATTPMDVRAAAPGARRARRGARSRGGGRVRHTGAALVRVDGGGARRVPEPVRAAGGADARAGPAEGARPGDLTAGTAPPGSGEDDGRPLFPGGQATA